MKRIAIIVLPMVLSACLNKGGGSSSSSSNPSNNNNSGGGTTSFAVTATAQAGGSITPESASIESGNTAAITITPDSGFEIDEVTGCGGTLEETTYTTGGISADCTVTATFTNTAQFVAFTVVDDLAGTSSLFSVRKGGSELTNLTPNIVTGGNVESFSWSADGVRIIYLADQNIDEVNELFSVLPDGSGQVTLNNTIVVGGDVIDFKLSPDGSKLVYRASQDAPNSIELYTVDLNGQNRVKVNSAIISGGNVEDYFWSPDGSYLLYTATADIIGQKELFLTAVDGSTIIKVNSVLNIGDTIEAFRWSPSGTFISYVVDDDLFVFNVTSSTNTHLDAAITESLNEEDYVWSDNDAFIAVSEAIRPSAGSTGQVFIFASDGSNTAMATLDIRHLTDHMAFIPNDTSLLVTADSGGLVFGDTATLYKFSDQGIQLDRDDLIATDRNRDQVTKSLFSPDGGQLALYGTGSSWFYDIENGTLTRFIDADSSGDSIETLAWSQDSSRLFYAPVIGDTSIVSPDASSLIVLNDLSGINTDNIQWVDNQLILTTSTGGTNGGGRVLKMDGMGANRQALGELPADTLGVGVHNIGSYTVSNDGAFLVYDLQSSRIDSQGEALFSVNFDGTDTIQINDDLPLNSGIKDYAIQPIN